MLGVGTGLERSSSVRLPQRAQALLIGDRSYSGGFGAGQCLVLCSAGCKKAGLAKPQPRELMKGPTPRDQKKSSCWWLYLHRPVFAAFQL